MKMSNGLPRLRLSRDDHAYRDTPLGCTPEYALCAAIMIQAIRDLHTEDPQIRDEAVRWFASDACVWLCAILDLDTATVQAKVRKHLSGDTP